ncbi:hypothetical protein, variant 1 [Aphanomyces invadans]|uniref:UDENN domain-containing protein n=1 Tax=Aphanomyces invadans TaxID=157072 RepID=A0A024U2K0_9STRA|nr:hypothetical protein, variant 1 [Aphanomyces invadans]ETW00454.1 hypothetical protein, variant 1 [Aphanomyces invadans]|eukprot:XP_008870589.1 hypothetical protein, variant 1 [Aphanomyces invadans]
MTLFEDVIIVEFEKQTQTPQIAWRYLTDAACAHVNNKSTIPVGLAAICAPAAGKFQKRGMEFTFTISDGRARQQYGYVKQIFVVTEDMSTQVVCILGPKPMYVWFTWVLRLFHARLLHDPSRRSAVTLLNAVRKAADADFTFRLALDHSTNPALYTFPLHPPGTFGLRTMDPHILNNRSFTNKLQSPTVLLVLLSALLHEQKVLLVHDERDVLRGTCQLLLRLLVPFTWKHLLIPVLPLDLLSYAQAPIPYLLGLTTDAYSRAALTNAIVFNLHEERIELHNLYAGFPTLCCDECPFIPPESNAAVPFAKLASSARHAATGNAPHSNLVDAFRHDLQHCFMNTPDGIEACVNALFLHVFGQIDWTRVGTTQEATERFQRAIAGQYPPSMVRFFTGLCSREVLGLYFTHALSTKATHFHGPLAVCSRGADQTYAALKRALQKRATYIQEYPSIVQILNGFCSTTAGTNERDFTTKELRPLADASYHMDQCALMVDILWERLGDANFSTLSCVLQVLVFLAIYGCEIAMEYMRFKECQRDHCQFLQQHPAKCIVDKAALLLDFMASPHRWFTMRATRSQELWLSTVVFPRLDIWTLSKRTSAIPPFATLHHTIGRFHQPVHSVNLLDLDFHVPASPGLTSKSTHELHGDPFDANASFPTHWG